MKTYWHKYNPWADKILYIPIEDAVALCDYGPRAINEILENWRQHGNKLDAYILPQPSGHHCIGIRYGKEASEYISAFANSVRTEKYLGENT